MSMSMRIYGYRQPDDKWKKMYRAHEACKAAGVRVPAEVEEFFREGVPETEEIEVDLSKSPGVEEYSADMQEGWEVELEDLPKNIKKIRFVNSY